jgi:hypothetical protein
MSSITNIRANAAFATFAARSARWHMQMLEILQSANDSGCVAMNQLPTQHCHTADCTQHRADAQMQIHMVHTQPILS